MSFKTNFTHIVCTYLKSIDSYVQNTDHSIFEVINMLPKKLKRGMWIKIAELNNLNSKEL
jgi:hypothetical protein